MDTLNLFGMSIDKFKRTLRLILVENFYSNAYYFVHKVCLKNAPHFAQSTFDKKVLVKQKDELLKHFYKHF